MMEKKEKKKKLVLIVDDHIMILKLTAEILKEAGFDATTVSTGREALEVLENQKPDVMLLDIYMPDMSGYDVLSGMKHSSRPAVIACSFDPSSQERALSLGADAFLAKPFGQKELLQKIHEITGPPDTEQGE